VAVRATPRCVFLCCTSYRPSRCTGVRQLNQPKRADTALRSALQTEPVQWMTAARCCTDTVGSLLCGPSSECQAAHGNSSTQHNCDCDSPFSSPSHVRITGGVVGSCFRSALTHPTAASDSSRTQRILCFTPFNMVLANGVGGASGVKAYFALLILSLTVTCVWPVFLSCVNATGRGAPQCLSTRIVFVALALCSMHTARAIRPLTVHSFVALLAIDSLLPDLCSPLPCLVGGFAQGQLCRVVLEHRQHGVEVQSAHERAYCDWRNRRTARHHRARPPCSGLCRCLSRRAHPPHCVGHLLGGSCSRCVLSQDLHSGPANKHAEHRRQYGPRRRFFVNGALFCLLDLLDAGSRAAGRCGGQSELGASPAAAQPGGPVATDQAGERAERQRPNGLCGGCWR